MFVSNLQLKQHSFGHNIFCFYCVSNIVTTAEYNRVILLCTSS